jgi:RNA polymerase-interacting CarD/CdnL/TRCF family regulator
MRENKKRQQYVSGLYVNSTYTTVAHYWLIKQLVRTSQWRMVSDKDNSILTAFYRVFAKEIKRADAHHFLFLTDRNKKLLFYIFLTILFTKILHVHNHVRLE